MTTLRKTPALSNNGGVKVNDDVYAEEVNANVVALWGRAACWLNSVAGTPNNITASADAPLTGAPTRPMAFWLVPVANNTAPVSLNIDSFGAFGVVDASGNTLGSGALTSGVMYLLVFDGTQYRVIFSSATTGADPDPDVIFVDQKTVNTAGSVGGITANAWITRNLNTTIQNEVSGCTLDTGTGQFTLQQGSYYIEWAAPAQGTNSSVSRLFNVTGNTTVAQGDTSFANSGDDVIAAGRALVLPSTTTVYRIEHQCSANNGNTSFGRPANIGLFEQYTVVKIWQLGQLASQVAGLPGGAISFFQSFNTSTSNADPGNGQTALNSSTQNTATAGYLDVLDFGLTDLTALLDTFDASTASVKGTIRYMKYDDVTKWLVFNLTARITHSGYREMTLAPVASSSANPFASGNKLLVTYTPVGPKGDTGATGAPGSTGTVSAANIGMSMINGSLVFSAASNILTVAIKQADGVTDPTAGAPTQIIMPQGLNTGRYQIVTITAAKSITISAGTTVGFVSGVPGRLWFFFTEDGQIGYVNCRDANNNIYPLGIPPQITTLTPGNNALQPYTPSAVSSKNYQVLGYASWETALGTAGNWSATPDWVVLHKPGNKLPGAVVQTVGASTSTTTGITSAAGTLTATALSLSITPVSKTNPTRVAGNMTYSGGNFTGPCGGQLYRGTVSTKIGNVTQGGENTGAGTSNWGTFNFFASDYPASASAVTYGVGGWSAGNGTVTMPSSAVSPATATMVADEIMG